MIHPVSVIIPAFNEGARLGATVVSVLNHLSRHSPASELIVVDDGSSDDTAKVARVSFAYFNDLRARVIRLEENRGKGFAVRTGLLAAKNRLAVFSDADLSTPIEELPKVIDPIEAGEYDVVFGSRALDRSLIGTHQSWGREQGGRVMNLIIRKATGLPIWDTQCGFKAFDMHFCAPLVEAGRIDRFGFDVELLYLMNAAGLRLHEVPVRWDHVDGSKLSVFRDTRRTLLEIAAIKRHHARGDYQAAIAATIALAAEVRKGITTGEADSPAAKNAAT
jgi:glycosyltransferase involved in cell wall biosynthesis